ncbi:MAG TPA: ribosome recycling factor [candidate division Zixibacteria bacterium]|nr:ribosome recycling factor [candidate division Zixibacteria bacterium]
MVDKIEKDAHDRMHKTIETLKREFGTVRTGKASPHLLDTVTVEAYGTQMPLNQVATVTAPEPRLLVVTPFDKSTVGNVVKGIQAADLGFNPMVDGQIIRVPIPALNEERRRTLVKQCKHLAEEARVAVRNIRRDANEYLKQAEKDSKISEDEMRKSLDKVQKLTDEHIKEIDSLLTVKEKEVMEV